MFGLFEPFATFDLTTVAIWYFATTAGVIAVSCCLVALGFKSGFDLDDYSIRHLIVVGVIIGPIAEELIFRGIPYFAFGTAAPVIVCSILWALLHGKRSPATAVSIPLYVKLWTGGFVVEAILIHSIHNGWVLAVYVLYRKFIRRSESRILDAAPAKIQDDDSP